MNGELPSTIADAAAALRDGTITSVALTESATKISSFAFTAIMCASPNSPGPLPGLPIAASTFPFKSSFRTCPAKPFTM